MFIYCCPFSSTESESNPNNNLMMRRAGLSRRKELTSWRFQVISGRMGMGGTSTMTWSPFPSRWRGWGSWSQTTLLLKEVRSRKLTKLTPAQICWPLCLSPLKFYQELLSGIMGLNSILSEWAQDSCIEVTSQHGQMRPSSWGPSSWGWKNIPANVDFFLFLSNVWFSVAPTGALREDINRN